MKNILVKKISMAVIFITLASICFSVSGQTIHDNSMLGKLEARLSVYKDMFRSGDYVKAASFVSPNMINRIGVE